MNQESLNFAHDNFAIVGVAPTHGQAIYLL